MGELVLVTGGAGTLARAVVEPLLERGHAVRSVDIRPIDGLPAEVETAIVDLRDPGAVERAMAGVVAIVHGAAWHGMHLRDHPARDFWELNVDGTFNLYEAALAAGVKAVVLSSTMGVYGESRRPEPDGPATRIREDLPLRPGDVYGASKVVAEELSAYYVRRGIAGACLRFGMFVPEPFLHAGIRFLYGGVDEGDVADAVERALDLALADGGHLGAFNIESALPFDEADGRLLRTDPLAAIARHWPDGPDLLSRAGTGPWGPITEIYEVERAARILGWRPRRGFAEFLDALRAGRESL
jgi:Nucleoside-diphosphate-sugar epimerases